MKLFVLKALKVPRKFSSFFYILYNRIVFRLNGVLYGKNLRVFNSFYLLKHYSAKITIGDNFIFTSGSAFNPLCRNIKGCIYATENAVISIGNNTGISSACLWAKERIEIGNNVNIGGDCIIMDTDAHNLDYRIRQSCAFDDEGHCIDTYTAASSPIIIHDNVLIGTRSIILKGVSIGARTVIGSGSVVTKSIPSDCIAAGNPCRVIRYFDSTVSSNR